ncbi:MAG: hypothetical protein M3Z31_09925 [Pseudomonadota bacterium]|nr:hypothetical protein [Pseudomonadota bacterium]
MSVQRSLYLRHIGKWVLTSLWLGCMATPAFALGRLADVRIVDRTDGRALPIVQKDGQAWVVGTPGHEYLVHIANRTGERILAVMSVDGVNVVSGETASPAQSGYVLARSDNVEVAGWRKSLATTAAFYFTDLGDAYATRTGRPDNVGVIGIAIFRGRAPLVLDELRDDAPVPRSAAEPANADTAKAAREPNARAAAPAPSLGTGHGRDEASAAQRVRFERASDTPAEVITVRYDGRANLIAMGILPRATIASGPRAFPRESAGFVADPPGR